MPNTSFILLFFVAFFFLLSAEYSRRQFFSHQTPSRKESGSRLSEYYMYHNFKIIIIVCDFFGGFILFGLFGFYFKNLVAYCLSMVALASYAGNIAVFIVIGLLFLAR